MRYLIPIIFILILINPTSGAKVILEQPYGDVEIHMGTTDYWLDFDLEYDDQLADPSISKVHRSEVTAGGYESCSGATPYTYKQFTFSAAGIDFIPSDGQINIAPFLVDEAQTAVSWGWKIIVWDDGDGRGPYYCTPLRFVFGFADGQTTGKSSWILAKTYRDTFEVTGGEKTVPTTADNPLEVNSTEESGFFADFTNLPVNFTSIFLAIMLIPILRKRK